MRQRSCIEKKRLAFFATFATAPALLALAALATLVSTDSAWATSGSTGSTGSTGATSAIGAGALQDKDQYVSAARIDFPNIYPAIYPAFPVTATFVPAYQRPNQASAAVLLAQNMPTESAGAQSGFGESPVPVMPEAIRGDFQSRPDFIKKKKPIVATPAAGEDLTVRGVVSENTKERKAALPSPAFSPVPVPVLVPASAAAGTNKLVSKPAVSSRVSDSALNSDAQVAFPVAPATPGTPSTPSTPATPSAFLAASAAATPAVTTLVPMPLVQKPDPTVPMPLAQKSDPTMPMPRPMSQPVPAQVIAGAGFLKSLNFFKSSPSPVAAIRVLPAPVAAAVAVPVAAAPVAAAVAVPVAAAPAAAAVAVPVAAAQEVKEVKVVKVSAVSSSARLFAFYAGLLGASLAGFAWVVPRLKKRNLAAKAAKDAKVSELNLDFEKVIQTVEVEVLLPVLSPVLAFSPSVEQVIDIGVEVQTPFFTRLPADKQAIDVEVQTPFFTRLPADKQAIDVEVQTSHQVLVEQTIKVEVLSPVLSPVLALSPLVEQIIDIDVEFSTPLTPDLIPALVHVTHLPYLPSVQTPQNLSTEHISYISQNLQSLKTLQNVEITSEKRRQQVVALELELQTIRRKPASEVGSLVSLRDEVTAVMSLISKAGGTNSLLFDALAALEPVVAMEIGRNCFRLNQDLSALVDADREKLASVKLASVMNLESMPMNLDAAEPQEVMNYISNSTARFLDTLGLKESDVMLVRIAKK